MVRASQFIYKSKVQIIPFLFTTKENTVQQSSDSQQWLHFGPINVTYAINQIVKYKQKQFIHKSNS